MNDAGITINDSFNDSYNNIIKQPTLRSTITDQLCGILVRYNPRRNRSFALWVIAIAERSVSGGYDLSYRPTG